jgi:hypothetical protein
VQKIADAINTLRRFIGRSPIKNKFLLDPTVEVLWRILARIAAQE